MDSEFSDMKEEELRVKFEVQSTAEDLRQFLDSPLWRDFCKLMENRLEVIQKDLTTVKTMEDLRELQGEYKGTEFWRVMPGMVHAQYELKEQMEAQKQKQKEQDNG